MSAPLPFPPMPSGRVARAPDGLRLYAVGDVHGRLDLLLEMERLIAEDARTARSATRIVMLGDYIDRGPDSAGVVAHLAERRRIDGRITLRGNHETYPLEAIGDAEVMVRWLDFGGREALRSWGVEVDAIGEASILANAPEIAAAIAERIPAEHMAFLRETALMHRAGDYLFVHAGVRPGLALDAQDPTDLLTIRKPFHGFDGDLGVVVVHGHTPGSEPVIRPNRVCIDTKAFASGRLTCLVMEGAERWFLST